MEAHSAASESAGYYSKGVIADDLLLRICRLLGCGACKATLALGTMESVKATAGWHVRRGRHRIAEGR